MSRDCYWSAPPLPLQWACPQYLWCYELYNAMLNGNRRLDMGNKRRLPESCLQGPAWLWPARIEMAYDICQAVLRPQVRDKLFLFFAAAIELLVTGFCLSHSHRLLRLRWVKLQIYSSLLVSR